MLNTTVTPVKSIVNMGQCSWIINRKGDGRVAWTVFSGDGEDVIDSGIEEMSVVAATARVVAVVTAFIVDNK